jgi:hypothetical protein
VRVDNRSGRYRTAQDRVVDADVDVDERIERSVDMKES